MADGNRKARRAPAVKNKKSCASCAHAMLADKPGEYFCIRFPPVPVHVVGHGISTHFPTTFGWAKCDEHTFGKPQEQNSRGT